MNGANSKKKFIDETLNFTFEFYVILFDGKLIIQSWSLNAKFRKKLEFKERI